MILKRYVLQNKHTIKPFIHLCSNLPNELIYVQYTSNKVIVAMVTNENRRKYLYFDSVFSISATK